MFTMTKRVLIVDDSRMSRMLIKALMEDVRPDWIYIEADCGDKALELATGEAVDLVTMDVNMPGLNGIEAASKFKALQPHAFVAMLTANIQTGMRQRAEAIGVNFYGKPVTDDIVAQIFADFDAAHG